MNIYTLLKLLGLIIIFLTSIILPLSLLESSIADLTDQYIEGYFKSDAFQEIPHYNTNIVKKFINRMSKIYTIGARRNVNDKYVDLSSVKNARMKQMERMKDFASTQVADYL